MNSDGKKPAANEARPLVRVLAAILAVMPLAATGIFVFSGQLAKDGMSVAISIFGMGVIALVLAIKGFVPHWLAYLPPGLHRTFRDRRLRRK